MNEHFEFLLYILFLCRLIEKLKKKKRKMSAKNKKFYFILAKNTYKSKLYSFLR